MNHLLATIERQAAKWQGKGYGGRSIRREIKAAGALLSDAPGLVIDVGGNIGSYSEAILARYPNTSIHIFEPSSRNARTLRAKFAGNDSVVIQQQALGREAAHRSIYADAEGSGLASLTKRRLDHLGIRFEWEEAVEVTRFEDYWRTVLDRRGVDLVKLDVEGHELDVLAGFGDAIAHVDVIQFEFGGCNIDTRTFFQDFWYFFKSADFDLFRITPFSLRPIPEYSERDEYFSFTNFLAKSRK